jgi:hypothetical protein
MTWTKSSDDYPDRLLDLSDAAYRLHRAATVFCNRLGLDGSLPRTRLALVPVPPRTRRLAVLRELIDAGHWIETDDGWTLTDFFDAQLSAEEVTLQRRWDVVRQQIRFAKKAQKKAELRADEDAIKAALWEAREQRKGLVSQRNSLVNSLRPVPTRIRPVPSLDEDEDERSGSGNPEGPQPSPGEAKRLLAAYGYTR